MRLVDPIPPVLHRAASLVEQAAASFLAGSLAIEAVDVTGEDYRDRFGDGVRLITPPWTAGQDALRDARAAVAQLGGDDQRAATALARLDAATAFVRRGYDYVGSVLMHLPQPFEQRDARIAIGRIGAAGRTIDASLRDAAAAIRSLAG